MPDAPRRVPVSVRSGLFALAGLLPSLAAQCATQWASTGLQAELTGQGSCTALWDPDGAGPEPERLVVGGDELIGGAAAIQQRVMLWDGSRWQALGPGPGTAGSVLALTVWNGQLVAGGDFSGGGFDRIALWDGSAWQPIGVGAFQAPVHDLAVWNGNLVAAATWPSALPQSTVRWWDGVSWSTLPLPWNGAAHALASYQGLLIVGGQTLFQQGVLGRWDGTNWLPPIPADARITSLAVRQPQVVGLDPVLYVGGAFTDIGGTAAVRIAATTGGASFAWSQTGGGLFTQCDALHVRNTGALGFAIVALAGGVPMQYLSGGSWISLGSLQLESVTYFGGSYHAARANGADACRRYDGASWLPVRGEGFDGEVRALVRSGTDTIVGGTFTATPDGARSRIARWDGTAFHALGAGMTGLVGGSTIVDALLTLANGDLVAGGSFVSAGGVTANSIARWNGAEWSSLGTGMNQHVSALCEMPNGDLVAGGSFTSAGGVPCAHIARWNGTSWSPLGSGTNATVHALAVRRDGVLFAGGSFSTAGGSPCSHIAQWNGTVWSPVGPGCNGDVFALSVRHGDEVIVAGSFTAAGGLPANRIARSLATGWSTMGAAGVDPAAARAVFVLPNGDVVAGRGFHQPGTLPDGGISRWDGSTWSGFGAGLAAAAPSSSVAARAFALRPDGSLVVGGNFSIAGGVVSRQLAVLSSACPPAVHAFGAGCSSAAGPVVVTAEALPWLGTTFRTTTTGIAPVSVCLGVVGLRSASIPLPSILPQGQPGCSLLASLDIVQLLQPDGAGSWQSALPVPASASLLGATFFQQTLPLEFDGTGAFMAARGSNGLAATIGTL
ncbi:MAG: hypothetical protein AB7O97_14235 [Planctomycetota bacterium]